MWQRTDLQGTAKTGALSVSTCETDPDDSTMDSPASPVTTTSPKVVLENNPSDVGDAPAPACSPMGEDF